MQRLFKIALAVVILGHVAFAGVQAFRPEMLAGILPDTGPQDAANIWRSIGSYNFSIAIGLLLSLRLGDSIREPVQMTVLALIAFTALVGYISTGSSVILVGRLLPSVVALGLLVALRAKEPHPA